MVNYRGYNIPTELKDIQDGSGDIHFGTVVLYNPEANLILTIPVMKEDIVSGETTFENVMNIATRQIDYIIDEDRKD